MQPRGRGAPRRGGSLIRRADKRPAGLSAPVFPFGDDGGWARGGRAWGPLAAGRCGLPGHLLIAPPQAIGIDDWAELAKVPAAQPLEASGGLEAQLSLRHADLRPGAAPRSNAVD